MIPTPATLQDLGALAWREFELFVTSVLRSYYKPFNLRLLSTPPSHDGARDAEAHCHLFAARPTKAWKNLASPFRLWVEVKQRAKTNIGLEPIAKNFIRAINEDVSKLIVVTNGAFTRGLQEEVERFSRRVRLDYCLLDGRTLLRLANSLDGGDHQNVHPVSTARSRAVVGGKSRNDYSNPIELGLYHFFTSDPANASLDSASLSGEPGAPIFVAADVRVISCPGPISLTLSASLRTPDLGNIYPYECLNVSELHDPSTRVPLALGDRRRCPFILFPSRPGLIHAKDILFTARAGGDSPLKLRPKSDSTYLTRNPRMSDWIPPSRIECIDSLVRELGRWRSSGESAAHLLLASAGVGKSHIVARLRRFWLTQGAIEVALDGQLHGTDLALMARVFDRAFPLEPRALGENQADSMAAWLERSGMPSGRAAEVASVVARKASLETLEPTLLAEIMATVLRRLSGTAPVILLFEDVHKARPSALTLLREVQRRLGESRVMLFLTSRYEPLTSDQGEQRSWHQGLDELLPTFTRTTLSALARPEAVQLIEHTIQTLEPPDANAIIDQVGTSPFGIREAINYLIDYGIAIFDESLAEYVVKRREILRRSLRLERFTQATAHRLERLRSRSRQWLGDFLDAASLLGRFFPVSTCLEVAGTSLTEETARTLGECERLELLKSSPLGPDSCGFDHDLVRAAVLRHLPPMQQRRMAEKLLVALPDADDFLLGSLAYQAGRAEQSADYLSNSALKSSSGGRYLDSVKALRVAIRLIDPSASAGRKSPRFEAADSEVDPALRQAPAVQLGTKTHVADYPRLLKLLRMLLFALTEMAGGGDPAMKEVLSEALLIARRIADEEALAELEAYEARWLFARGHLNEAVAQHRKAEDRYATLAQVSLSSKRLENLIRLATSLRQVGEAAASLEVLARAEKLREPNDLTARVRILANTGALFIYSDHEKLRDFWEQALAVARTSALPHNIIHSLVDLVEVDIFGDQYSQAQVRLQESLRLAEQYGLESEYIRILTHFACINIIFSDLDNARRDLFEAEGVAILGGNQRRLWRLRANLATIYELCGDARKSYARDREACEQIVPLILEMLPTVRRGAPLRREFLGVANVVLRADSSVLHAKLRDEIPAEILGATRPIVDAALTAKLESAPNLLGRHCKTLRSGLRRFVITE